MKKTSKCLATLATIVIGVSSMAGYMGLVIKAQSDSLHRANAAGNTKAFPPKPGVHPAYDREMGLGSK